MILERFMVTGRRSDNGDTILGYFAESDGETYIFSGDGIVSRTNQTITSGEYLLVVECYKVDPETVEPLAVRVVDPENECRCPNCGETITCLPGCCDMPKSCPGCGQRLFWEDN